MKDKKTGSLSIRLTQENKQRVERAQEIGFTMGNIVNELLEQHFEDYLMEKSKKLQNALKAA